MTNATAPGRELAELVERHPLRRLILERTVAALETGDVSPVDLARDLDTPLGRLAYHVRVLERAGALELVEERRVRGAVEHVYRATAAGELALEASPLAIALAALERIAGDAGRVDLDRGDLLGIAEDALDRIAKASTPRRR